MVNSLGASGYPALQNFLSHILDKRNRFFLLSSKKMFFVLMAALAVEMLEEVFWEGKNARRAVIEAVDSNKSTFPSFSKRSVAFSYYLS